MAKPKKKTEDIPTPPAGVAPAVIILPAEAIVSEPQGQTCTTCGTIHALEACPTCGTRIGGGA